MKKLNLLMIVFIAVTLSAAEIKINEVLYDPEGSDSGLEWIEIYNNSFETVNLSGWQILKAGTEFTAVFTFVDFSIAPYSYVLVGEEYVLSADITATLAFQNGGSATDGIRLVSEDGQYTDTVLYDTPNTNFLTDDNGNVAEYFAPDVSSGYTLARISDGADTNDSSVDFFSCDYPTPGSGNLYPVDLAITGIQLLESVSGYQLIITIENLSSIDVDNFEAYLEIAVNDNCCMIVDLPLLPAGETTEYTVNMDDFGEGYFLIEVKLNYINDLELINNVVRTSLLEGYPPLVINEIMFKPQSNMPEWLEIYNLSTCAYCVDNFMIIDASAGEINFEGNIDSGQYLVITEDIEMFQNYFPLVPTELIVEAISWTPLNNGEEELVFQDSFGTCFEDLFYSGEVISVGSSLERINPSLPPDYDNWGESITGSTPGSQNSIFIDYLPVSAKLNVQPNPFSPLLGESAIISFNLPEELSMVTLKIFDLKGRIVDTLADQDLQAPQGEFIWNGRSSGGRKHIPGIYIILMQATGQESEKVYELTSTVVIAL